MPSLKAIHCCIELPNGKTQFREFGTTYGDGCVETFVAVPKHPQSFAIRLSSSQFVAPGLAMFVFIDGVYQCNRNRQNLRLRKPPDRKSLVDFVVRQKEEQKDNGTMIARDWNFEKLDIVSANEAPDACSPRVLENLGCIEVVVLRCAGMRCAKSAKVKPMNLDGAGDMPEHHFGLDGAPNPYVPQYDDRAWEYIWGGSKYAAPMRGSPNNHSGLPSSLNSRLHTTGPRNTLPVTQSSPRLQDILRSPENLAGSIRYGSGPVPRRPRSTSMHAPAPSIQGASAAYMPFDPQSLDHALTNMVKRSPEGYYQPIRSPTIPVDPPIGHPSHVPGSWPSPHGPPAPLFVSPVENLEIGLATPPPPPAAALGLPLSPQDAHISWDQRPPEPSKGWNEGNGWDLGEYENDSSTWDSGNTWGSSQQANERSASKYERARERIPVGWNTPATHAPSPTARTARTGPWSHSSEFQTARSQYSEPFWGSKEDSDGWTYIEASSDSSGSWALPVHPSESVSHVAGLPSVAPEASQVPLAHDLSRKLHPLRDAEETRRRPVAKGPPTSLFTATQLPNVGFSTFEKAVRGVLGDGKAASGHKANCTTVAPTVWAAVEDSSHQSLWNRPSSFEDDCEKNDNLDPDVPVSDKKGWREPTKATRDNGWDAKETTRPPGRWPSVIQDSGHMAKEDRTTEEIVGEYAKHESWDLHEEPEMSKISNTSWQADINGWSTSENDKPLKNGRNPWTSTTEIKNQPSKLRQSEDRQLCFSPTKTSARGHWQFPPPVSEKKPKADSEKTGMGAQPLLKVVKQDAVEKAIEHQVRTGQGSKYGHAIGRPEYLDSLEKPYAVFRFKYRAHSTLRKLLGKDVVPSDATLLTNGPVDPLTYSQPDKSVQVDEAKQQLKKVPKDALIDGLLHLQTKLEKEKKAPERVDMNRTKN